MKFKKKYAYCSHSECSRHQECNRWIDIKKIKEHPKCFVLLTLTIDCKCFDPKEL